MNLRSTCSSLLILATALLGSCAGTAGVAAVDVEAWRLLAQGHPEIALEAFEGAAEESTDEAAAVRCELGRSRSLEALGRPLEATAAARRVLDLAPDLAQGHLDLGVLLLDQGQTAGALASFERVLELEPSSAAAAYDRGLALVELGAEEAALSAFGAAVALDRSCGPAHNGRGVLLARQGRLEAAVDAFRRATECDAGTEARVNLAMALHTLGENEHALIELNAAARLEPDRPEPYLARATVLAELGDPDLARADLLEALELAPDSEEALLRLAELRR